MSSILSIPQLLSRFDPETGGMGDQPQIKRYLADLRGSFNDAQAFANALSQGNPLIYSVAAVEPAAGAGDLHYGLGVIYPGLVGDEYFLTKGHLHTWREAAEVYIGLGGKGVMLLEDVATGESRMIPLQPNSIVYVPGNTAHRTVNTGEAPLAYLGVYPARAGHDYGALAQRNFRHVVVKRGGEPRMIQRH